MLDWLADNWLWLGIGALFVWMHLRPGGCHAHGGHQDHDRHTTGHPREDPADHAERDAR
jgi:hypothetical protein